MQGGGAIRPIKLAKPTLDQARESFFVRLWAMRGMPHFRDHA
jgi:hypothetical protein